MEKATILHDQTTTYGPMASSEAGVNQGILSMSAAQAQETGTISLSTRFGNFEFDRAQALNMPHGMLGFAGYSEFGLATPPGDGFGQFRILQSLQDAELSFIVLPLTVDNNLIDRADIEDAATSLDANIDDMGVLLIATIRKLPDGAKLTVNTQAPIMIDAGRRLAWQYILHNPKYTVQHELG